MCLQDCTPCNWSEKLTCPMTLSLIYSPSFLSPKSSAEGLASCKTKIRQRDRLQSWSVLIGNFCDIFLCIYRKLVPEGTAPVFMRQKSMKDWGWNDSMFLVPVGNVPLDVQSNLSMSSQEVYAGLYQTSMSSTASYYWKLLPKSPGCSLFIQESYIPSVSCWIKVLSKLESRGPDCTYKIQITKAYITLKINTILKHPLIPNGLYFILKFVTTTA